MSNVPGERAWTFFFFFFFWVTKVFSVGLSLSNDWLIEMLHPIFLGHLPKRARSVWVCVCVCVWMYEYVCMCVYVSVCVCECVCECECVYMNLWVCVHVCVCVCVVSRRGRGQSLERAPERIPGLLCWALSASRRPGGRTCFSTCWCSWGRRWDRGSGASAEPTETGGSSSGDEDRPDTS